MDKRKILSTIEVKYNDKAVKVNLYYSPCKRIIFRFSYGELEIYYHTIIGQEKLKNYCIEFLKKNKNFFLDRPYYKEGLYIFVRGKKKYLTTDIHLKNNQTFFYYPKNSIDPIKQYKRDFLEYATIKIKKYSKKMNIDISDYKIRTILSLSYYGCFMKKDRQIKFDYRLFAFKDEIMDTVFYHELAHYFEPKHNDRFYTIVQLYCPDYFKYHFYLTHGYFQGDLDVYEKSINN